VDSTKEDAKYWGMYMVGGWWWWWCRRFPEYQPACSCVIFPADMPEIVGPLGVFGMFPNMGNHSTTLTGEQCRNFLLTVLPPELWIDPWIQYDILFNIDFECCFICEWINPSWCSLR
jgi:hypothetical protein